MSQNPPVTITVVTSDETGSTITDVNVSVGGEMIDNLTDLEKDPSSPPSQYNGRQGTLSRLSVCGCLDLTEGVVRRHRMVNMVLVAANKTGGLIERINIAIAGKKLVSLPELATGEHSPPTLYNGPPGSHVWQVWLVDEDGKRRRGSVCCAVTHADNDRCALITLRHCDFVISKGHRLKAKLFVHKHEGGASIVWWGLVARSIDMLHLGADWRLFTAKLWLFDLKMQ